MMLALASSWHVAFVLLLTAAVMVLYASEKLPLEVTSLTALVALLVWFQLFSIVDGEVERTIGTTVLLAGFANPALIAVLSLLVMGQAVVQTGALAGVARGFIARTRSRRRLSLGTAYGAVVGTSAFLNNTPVVVMFIPIMEAVARRMGWPPGRLLMPLSYTAILGGTLTLIGSSTNLLAASVLSSMTGYRMSMFEITGIAAVMALVGMIYVAFVLPRLLPIRDDLPGLTLREGKQFIAEIRVTIANGLAGQTARAGQFPGLPDVTVRLIQRGGESMLPPFDGMPLEPGDTLIVAATRPALAEVLPVVHGALVGSEERGTRHMAERVLAEIMIAPASRMIDRSIEALALDSRLGWTVLGIQRRGRMARQRLGEIRLEAGDVLLVVATEDRLDGLRRNPDVILTSRGTWELPRLAHGPTALVIFGIAVFCASTGLLAIEVAGLAGALAMLLTGCLNVRQAARAIDRQIIMLVGASLALGVALQETGAALAVAEAVLDLLPGAGPWAVLVALYAIVAIGTNVLSNNACAVLFMPIGIGLAQSAGFPPYLAAVTVILGANCAFATPIGYQTNLLVMGPGHYRFSDFLRGGLPMMALMVLTFAVAMPLIYPL